GGLFAQPLLLDAAALRVAGLTLLAAGELGSAVLVGGDAARRVRLAALRPAAARARCLRRLALVAGCHDAAARARVADLVRPAALAAACRPRRADAADPVRAAHLVGRAAQRRSEASDGCIDAA